MTKERLCKFWKGRQVEDLTRDELVAALNELIPRCIDLQMKVLAESDARMQDFIESHEKKNIS